MDKKILTFGDIEIEKKKTKKKTKQKNKTNKQKTQPTQ